MKFKKTFRAEDFASNRIEAEGTYNFEITGTEEKESKSGNMMLIYEYTVPETEATIRDRFNIWHKEENVREIACEKLANLMNAVGLDEMDDTEELLGLKFRGKVEKQKNSDYFEVRRYINPKKVKAKKSDDGKKAKAKAEKTPDRSIDDGVPF